MVNREDLESFLVRLGAEGASYSEVEPGMFVVRPGGTPDAQVVVHLTPPVLLMRMNVLPVPADAETAARLARRLLELNATDLVHGAYGISGNDIILTEALELANLDFSEFLAAYESMTLALASHVRELAPFREVH
ncbi:MAG: hypothetical protein U5K74_15750 [Gemmatimonadaceae bacterium]|nr:hypothetical protein [Gemmatimonadaceae bacterium]